MGSRIQKVIYTVEKKKRREINNAELNECVKRYLQSFHKILKQRLYWRTVQNFISLWLNTRQ